MTFLCVTWVASSSSCLKRSMMAWVAGQIRPDNFQRHHAIQFEVARLIDRAHAAFAEDLQDFITLPQQAARFQHRRAGLGSRLPRRRFSGERADALDHGGRIGARNVHHSGRVRRVAPEYPPSSENRREERALGREYRSAWANPRRSSPGRRAVTLGRRAQGRTTFTSV